MREKDEKVKRGRQTAREGIKIEEGKKGVEKWFCWSDLLDLTIPRFVHLGIQRPKSDLERKRNANRKKTTWKRPNLDVIFFVFRCFLA